MKKNYMIKNKLDEKEKSREAQEIYRGYEDNLLFKSGFLSLINRDSIILREVE